MRDIYHTIKSRAIFKKQEWDWSFEEFKEFCKGTDYIELKSRSADGLTIDRIRSGEGYKKGNVQMLPQGINSAKQNLDYASPRYVEYLRRTGQHPNQGTKAVQPQAEDDNGGSIF